MPVLACPITSRPSSASPRHISWMGKAVVMPCSARASTMGFATPSAANVGGMIGASVVGASAVGASVVAASVVARSSFVVLRGTPR